MECGVAANAGREATMSIIAKRVLVLMRSVQSVRQIPVSQTPLFCYSCGNLLIPLQSSYTDTPTSQGSLHH